MKVIIIKQYQKYKVDDIIEQVEDVIKATE